MDLRSLVPAVEALAAPLGSVLGDGGSGLSGIGAQLEHLDLSDVASTFGGVLQRAFEAELPAQGGGPSLQAAGSLGGLSQVVSAVPADLLSGVTQPLGDLQGVLARLPELVGRLTPLVDAVQSARHGDLGPVLQQAGDALLAVADRATGGDFAEFADWRVYLEELAAAIRPVIAAGGTPDAMRDALLALALQRARETILDIAPTLTQVMLNSAPTLGGLLPDVSGLGLDALRDAALAALNDLQSAAQTAGGDVATRVNTYQTRLFTLLDTLQTALDQVEAQFGNPVLTPGSITTLAGAEIDRVLSLQVSDFSNVQARLQGFYDQIEQALSVVDLSPVTGQITGFFGSINSAVGGLDFAVLGTELDQLGTQVEQLVAQLGVVLTQLRARLQQWLGELKSQLDSALGALGTFDTQHRFRFFFQDDIDALFGRIDLLIQGDPAHPDAFSVRKALQDVQAGLIQLIEQIEAALQGLAGELDSAKTQLAAALEEVRAGIESVDPSTVMEQAKAGLEQAFQEIGDLELDALVDPVVQELNDARDALAQIDPSQLDDLLRAALRAVLDAITTSDFDRQLTAPLLREFDTLLETPKAALASFADKVQELLGRIAAISPEALFAPVQEQLDRITGSLDLNLVSLLEPPLNQALAGVKRQLASLDPTPLLAPIQGAFDTLSGAVDKLKPESLLAPAQTQIDRLGEGLRSLNLDEPLTAVSAVFGDLERFLDEIDPTRLLRPLMEPFDQARRTLDTLRPSVLLAPLTDIMSQLGDLATAVPESVALQARALFDEAMARIDSLNPTALFDGIRSVMAALRARVDTLGAPVLLHALQGGYDTARAAVVAADARDGTALATTLTPFEPSRAFGAVIARYDRIQLRVRAVIDALDPTPLITRYEQARARIDEILPRAIRGDITASQIQTLLNLTNPAQLITRLDTVYQRIVDQLLSLNPSLIIAPLATLHDGLRTLLGSVDIGALTARIRTVLGSVADLIAGISLASLAAPILEEVQSLKSVVLALNPASIISGLRQRFDSTLSLLEEVSVRAVLATLQQSWEEITERIRSLFDIGALLEPLTAITTQIQALIGGIDLGELVGVLDQKLDKLRDELEEALNRTGDAFKAMLAAAPV